MDIMPLNVEYNLNYNYYKDSNEAINDWAVRLESLSSSDIKNRYLEFTNICFSSWELKLEGLVQDEEYSLHIGILIPAFELKSINNIIQQFNSHDINIVYNKDLYITQILDDFGELRPNLYSKNDEPSILKASFIIIKIKPHLNLDSHIRQTISYLLAIIFRMFSIQEGHIEHWFIRQGLDYTKAESFLDFEEALEFVCTVNNFFVKEALLRAQLICSTINVSPELLLQVNDIERISKLFEEYNTGMIKPSQTNIILALKGAVGE